MITRSTGIHVRGWAGSFPGGGYSGATAELDAAVQCAAEALVAWSGGDVEIRFNSDRMGGGAYTKGVMADEIGILVSLQPRTPGRRASMAEWRRDAMNGKVAFHVLADVNRLQDESLATEGTFGSEYACPEVSSVEEAFSWIEANCKHEAAVRVTADERARWERRKVSLGERSVTFAECVQAAGDRVKYGGLDREQAVAWLREKGIKPKVAAEIVEAVWRILPRRG